MDLNSLKNELLFFVNMRLEDVAEDPKRLKRAQELIATDIQTVLETNCAEVLEPGESAEVSAPALALRELLDPNIAVPLEELAVWAESNKAAHKTLLDEFEDLSRAMPTDQWILKVLTMPEAEQPYWKAALSAVYSVITGPGDRRLSETWTLIERTNEMVRPKSG